MRERAKPWRSIADRENCTLDTKVGGRKVRWHVKRYTAIDHGSTFTAFFLFSTFASEKLIVRPVGTVQIWNVTLPAGVCPTVGIGGHATGGGYGLLSRSHGVVADHIEGRTLGFIGEPRVNVLALNLALEEVIDGR